MFTDLTLRRNPELIKTAFDLHGSGKIKPDTYILDLDAIVRNARLIKKEADRYGIKLYFMTKQIGRNPYVAAELMKLGYDGAVAVDYREACTLYDAGIKIGHVGHLVQVPKWSIKDMLLKRPEIITVYSFEKARQISDAAVDIGITQDIMLRVINDHDVIYPGQYGGFYLGDLVENGKKILNMKNIRIHGVTSFPCFLVDSESKTIKETNNMRTVMKAKCMLEDKLGIKIAQVNTPSATCTASIRSISEFGGTHGEPGHGITGTTPLHSIVDQPEIPSIVYVSEVSHTLDGMSYCFGGGYYRRSFMKKAFVGNSFENLRTFDVETPDDTSIDYHIGLDGKANVGDTAVFAFRTQIFVTRSEVAVVKGISSGNPEITGIYDSLGRLLRRVE